MLDCATVRWLWVVCLSLGLAACGGKGKGQSDAGVRPPKRKGSAAGAAEPGSLVQLRLEEAMGDERGADRAKVVLGTALSAAETQALLKRVPALTAEAGDEKTFALRERSLPAPRTGATVHGVFPPPPRPAPKTPEATGALEVLRFSPDGEIPLAPNLSVTFSHPMVAVTSHADALKQSLPVKLKPEVPGTWRWVGTKTLLFEPKIRFAMATRYEAEVPAGTPSALGGKLAQAKRWTFATPAPRLLSSHPHGSSQPLEPLFFASFDQAVSPEAVLRSVTLEGDGKRYSVRLATPEDLAQDEQVRLMSASAEKGRWLAFRAVERLPAATIFTVTFEPGTPSAEGPLTTKEAQRFTFETYAPLKITHHSCEWRYPCSPLSSVYVSFNNPLDEEAFDPKRVKVSPAIPDLKVEVHGSSISLSGRTRASTTYRVTVPASMTDTYGQRLGADESVTLHVGKAYPRLFHAGGDFMVLDPDGDKHFSFFSVGQRSLEVRVHAVGPDDWAAFRKFAAEGMRQVVPPRLPGRPRVHRVMSPKGGMDDLIETRLDLRPALANGKGQVAVLITQNPLPAKPYERHYVLAWLQVTDLAVDAFSDGEKLLAWATRLRDGRPAGGAEVTLEPVGSRVRADGSGLARFTLPDDSGASARMLVARQGGDVAILPRTTYYWGNYGGWARQRRAVDTVKWFVFDDRHLYKPKEEVRVKGWLRRVGLGRGGDVTPAGIDRVTFEVREARGNRLTSGVAKVGPLGGFDLRFKLPDNANLGSAYVSLSAPGLSHLSGSTHSHSFQIQEFRRPEFEVSAAGSEGPHFIGGHADVSVSASYFAGGPLPHAEVAWSVSASHGYFYPPNQSDYSFGVVREYNWWTQTPTAPLPPAQSLSAHTDGRGLHRVRIHVARTALPELGAKKEEPVPLRPLSVVASATVQDVNRQSWTATRAVLVHPARHYVGLKTERFFFERGQPLKVDLVVSDLDGKLVPGRAVAVRAVRLEYSYRRGKYEEDELDPQRCDVTSAVKAVSCTFTSQKGGSYLIQATVKDPEGRANRSELTRWVAGGRVPLERSLKQQEVRLIANKKLYEPGETAELLVLSPFYPAEGLLTLRRAGLLEERRFQLTGPTTTLRVQLTPSGGSGLCARESSQYDADACQKHREGFMPNLPVQVNLVGSALRVSDDGVELANLPRRPAYARGNVSLAISTKRRELQVEVKSSPEKTEPGAATKIAVTVRDAAQKPVAGAEVALVVVDEAVLALSGYRIGNPLHTFHPYRWDGVEDLYLRQWVHLADPELVTRTDQRRNEGGGPGGGGRARTGALREESKTSADRAPAPAATAAPASPPKQAMAKSRAAGGKDDESGLAGLARAGEAAPKPIALRKDFSALALFAPSLSTDAQGRVEVPFKLPDNLTRYRIMAVAVARERFFGNGEGTLTARLPLMVRPSAPRFLNFGDRFELPVVLQNQTDQPLPVKLAVRATGAELVQGQGRALTVPPNDRVEVRFLTTTLHPGTARFQIAAAAGSHADAAELSLPVWTPATTEAFATYGTVDKGAVVQPVKLPSGVFTEFGGLEVSTSSTELQALTDAVLYLVSYPYECSEQLSSRILAVAALKDVLSAFKAKGLPSPATILAAMDRDLKRLQGMQNGDGGFPLWERGRPSWPFVSIHVTHALVRAKLKGFAVPPTMYASALAHLRNIESYIPSEYSEATRRAIVTYAVYVRSLSGDADVVKAKGLFSLLKQEKDLPLEGVAWLYPVLSGSPQASAEVTEIRRLLRTRVSETAATAQFAASYGDSNYLLMYSDRRLDALLLEGLIKDQPESDLIVKLVRGLLGHRKEGRWGSTQENAWVLLALDKYFHAYEKVTPNFVARAWLGERFAGEHRFKGRTTERHSILVPMAFLAQGSGTNDLVLGKQGAGRLYYRIGMSYAPKDLRPPPASHGFTVERTYEAVDKPEEVRRDAQGVWHVKAGARVRVRLTLVAPARRYHVALVDPLPAGLEAVNAALLGSAQPVPAAPSTGAPPPSGGRFRGGLGRYAASPAYYHSWLYWGRWYEHENLRDERAEAFASLLWEGVHTYSYVARATTPGTFVVPPPKAEEMYHPETFGRGAGDRLIVE